MSKSWKASLAEVLRTHNRVRSGGSVASYLTQEKRGDVLFAGFAKLRELGYRLEDVRQFKGRHMQALADAWVKEGLGTSALQNYISTFRTFAGWIGKAGMVLRTEDYVGPEKARRTSINTEDKSWSAKGVDVDAKIAEVRAVDPRIAMQLELQQAFKLRPSEAMQLRPHLADRGHYLAINWGTKGGRDRVVDIATPQQRDVLDRAKALAATPSASMCDPSLTLKQAKGHYYRVVAKCGITKATGAITSYGLRHAGANDRYKELTGEDSPVRGGGDVDPELDRHARQIIAEELGHSRQHIVTNYIGR
jgi:hypothetical protein